MKNIDLKGIKGADNLNPEFIDDLECFLPMWLESLVPYYDVGKKMKVDVMDLSNVVNVGNDFEEYEVDGLHFYLTKYPGSTDFVINADKGYKQVGWHECFKEWTGGKYDDFSYFNEYCWISRLATRWQNQKETILVDIVNDYFKKLVNDATITFDLGRTPIIIYNPQYANFVRRNYLWRS